MILAGYNLIWLSLAGLDLYSDASSLQLVEQMRKKKHILEPHSKYTAQSGAVMMIDSGCLNPNLCSTLSCNKKETCSIRSMWCHLIAKWHHNITFHSGVNFDYTHYFLILTLSSHGCMPPSSSPVSFTFSEFLSFRGTDTRSSSVVTHLDTCRQNTTKFMVGI